MASLVDIFFKSLTENLNKPQGLKPSLDVPVSASGFKFYHRATVDERESLHECLNDLAHKHSWLKLSYISKSFDDHNLLDRIKITDSRDFLSYIGMPVVADNIAEAIQHIVDAKLVLPDRFNNLKEELKDSWGKGKRYYSCDYGSPNKLLDALRVIEYLHQQSDSKTIDYRTLSVRLFSDSKWFEKLKILISNLLKPITPELNASKPDTVLAYWGVYKFPPSLQLKGNLTVITPKGPLYTDNAWPFLGIPPDAIKAINIDVKPEYVLFIENKTTFERYSREVDDRGLIIYTNGFPSRHWQLVFQTLDDAIDISVSFYHWGDVDIGGFKILRFMASLFRRPLYPHQMDIITKANDDNGASAKELLNIINYSGHPIISKSIISMLSQFDDEKIARIEQETLDLKSPMLNN